MILSRDKSVAISEDGRRAYIYRHRSLPRVAIVPNGSIVVIHKLSKARRKAAKRAQTQQRRNDAHLHD